MWRHRRALPRQTPGGRRSARARGGAFPSPPKGGGAAPGAGYHGNRKARDRPPSAPQQVRRPGPRGVRLHRAPDAAPASTHRTQAPNSGAGTGQGLLGPSLRRARLCSLRSAPGGPSFFCMAASSSSSCRSPTSHTQWSRPRPGAPKP
ncbi:uncharacterized protein LOC122235705 isoform X4 [Panthera tigris]|uniref:uncharacterized protein LOC122235705 isoform X4 n=1 Tax=Panthera tigris TaxID=9694 RepID=UPI001C6FB81E|nr:uncharacterized protein LOC122235705 isoform X4 [Panthera tigris]